MVDLDALQLPRRPPGDAELAAADLERGAAETDRLADLVPI